MILDANNNVLGRLATRVVQALKDGEDVHIVNADNVIVKGRPEDIVSRYRAKYERGSIAHGPRFPKSPDRIVKRTVRGMLPRTKQGRDMLKRLRVYRNQPEQLDDAEPAGAEVKSLKGSNFMRMVEISENLGR